MESPQFPVTPVLINPLLVSRKKSTKSAIRCFSRHPWAAAVAYPPSPPHSSLGHANRLQFGPSRRNNLQLSQRSREALRRRPSPPREVLSFNSLLFFSQISPSHATHRNPSLRRRARRRRSARRARMLAPAPLPEAHRGISLRFPFSLFSFISSI